jgi:hypothetical protein
MAPTTLNSNQGMDWERSFCGMSAFLYGAAGLNAGILRIHSRFVRLVFWLPVL